MPPAPKKRPLAPTQTKTRSTTEKKPRNNHTPSSSNSITPQTNTNTTKNDPNDIVQLNNVENSITTNNMDARNVIITTSSSTTTAPITTATSPRQPSMTNLTTTSGPTLTTTSTKTLPSNLLIKDGHNTATTTGTIITTTTNNNNHPTIMITHPHPLLKDQLLPHTSPPQQQQLHTPLSSSSTSIYKPHEVTTELLTGKIGVLDISKFPFFLTNNLYLCKLCRRRYRGQIAASTRIRPNTNQPHQSTVLTNTSTTTTTTNNNNNNNNPNDDDPTSQKQLHQRDLLFNGLLNAEYHRLTDHPDENFGDTFICSQHPSKHCDYNGWLVHELIHHRMYYCPFEPCCNVSIDNNNNINKDMNNDEKNLTKPTTVQESTHLALQKKGRTSSRLASSAATTTAAPGSTTLVNPSTSPQNTIIPSNDDNNHIPTTTPNSILSPPNTHSITPQRQPLSLVMLRQHLKQHHVVLVDSSSITTNTPIVTTGLSSSFSPVLTPTIHIDVIPPLPPLSSAITSTISILNHGMQLSDYNDRIEVIDELNTHDNSDHNNTNTKNNILTTMTNIDDGIVDNNINQSKTLATTTTATTATTTSITPVITLPSSMGNQETDSIGITSFIPNYLHYFEYQELFNERHLWLQHAISECFIPADKWSESEFVKKPPKACFPYAILSEADTTTINTNQNTTKSIYPVTIAKDPILGTGDDDLFDPVTITKQSKTQQSSSTSSSSIKQQQQQQQQQLNTLIKPQSVTIKSPHQSRPSSSVVLSSTSSSSSSRKQYPQHIIDAFNKTKQIQNALTRVQIAKNAAANDGPIVSTSTTHSNATTVQSKAHSTTNTPTKPSTTLVIQQNNGIDNNGVKVDSVKQQQQQQQNNNVKQDSSTLPPTAAIATTPTHSIMTSGPTTTTSKSTVSIQPQPVGPNPPPARQVRGNKRAQQQQQQQQQQPPPPQRANSNDSNKEKLTPPRSPIITPLLQHELSNSNLDSLNTIDTNISMNNSQTTSNQMIDLTQSGKYTPSSTSMNPPVQPLPKRYADQYEMADDEDPFAVLPQNIITNSPNISSALPHSRTPSTCDLGHISIGGGGGGGIMGDNTATTTNLVLLSADTHELDNNNGGGYDHNDDDCVVMGGVISATRTSRVVSPNMSPMIRAQLKLSNERSNESFEQINHHTTTATVGISNSSMNINVNHVNNINQCNNGTIVTPTGAAITNTGHITGLKQPPERRGKRKQVGVVSTSTVGEKITKKASAAKTTTTPPPNDILPFVSNDGEHNAAAGLIVSENATTAMNDNDNSHNNNDNNNSDHEIHENINNKNDGSNNNDANSHKNKNDDDDHQKNTRNTINQDYINTNQNINTDLQHPPSQQHHQQQQSQQHQQQQYHHYQQSSSQQQTQNKAQQQYHLGSQQQQQQHNSSSQQQTNNPYTNQQSPPILSQVAVNRRNNANTNAAIFHNPLQQQTSTTMLKTITPTRKPMSKDNNKVYIGNPALAAAIVNTMASDSHNTAILPSINTHGNAATPPPPHHHQHHSSNTQLNQGNIPVGNNDVQHHTNYGSTRDFTHVRSQAVFDMQMNIINLQREIQEKSVEDHAVIIRLQVEVLRLQKAYQQKQQFYFNKLSQLQQQLDNIQRIYPNNNSNNTWGDLSTGPAYFHPPHSTTLTRNNSQQNPSTALLPAPLSMNTSQSLLLYQNQHSNQNQINNNSNNNNSASLTGPSQLVNNNSNNNNINNTFPPNTARASSIERIQQVAAPNNQSNNNSANVNHNNPNNTHISTTTVIGRNIPSHKRDSQTTTLQYNAMLQSAIDVGGGQGLSKLSVIGSVGNLNVDTNAIDASKLHSPPQITSTGKYSHQHAALLKNQHNMSNNSE